MYYYSKLIHIFAKIYNYTNMANRKMSPLGKKILIALVTILLSVASSKIATKNPFIDSALKEFIQSTSDILIEALTSSPSAVDSTYTVKLDSVQISKSIN